MPSRLSPPAERTPYKDATYTDICHEAQAIYDDTCADQQLNLIGGACLPRQPRRHGQGGGRLQKSAAGKEGVVHSGRQS